MLTTQHLAEAIREGTACREQAAWEGRPPSDQWLSSLVYKVGKGFQEKRRLWTKACRCEPAWRIRAGADSPLWLVGGIEGGCHVQSGL